MNSDTFEAMLLPVMSYWNGIIHLAPYVLAWLLLQGMGGGGDVLLYSKNILICWFSHLLQTFSRLNSK